MTRCAKSERAIADRRGRRLAAACLAGMLAGVVGTEVRAQADVVAPNRIFAGCKLSAATLNSLRNDILKEATTNDFGIGDPAVDVVVVYRFETPNWGQPVFTKEQGSQVPTGDFTARVICANDENGDDPPEDVADTVRLANENEDFPLSGTVDVLNFDETLAIRVFGLSDTDFDDQYAAKVCLTANPDPESETGAVETIDCAVFELPSP